MRALLLLMLLPSLAFATDITVAWQAVSTYEWTENGVLKTAPMPPGVITYEVWGFREGETPVKRAETNTTSNVRPNVAAGNQCYYIVARFVPTTATQDVWGPSRSSDTRCTTVVAGVGPRNVAPAPPVILKVGP